MKISFLSLLLTLSASAIAGKWNGKECPKHDSNFVACSNGQGSNCPQFYGCWYEGNTKHGVGKITLTSPEDAEQINKKGGNASLFGKGGRGKGGGSGGDSEGDLE